MKTLHIDALSGMAGDMFMAALVDAGLNADELAQALKGLPLDNFRLESREVMRGAIRATKMDVLVRTADGQERHEARDEDHALGRSSAHDHPAHDHHHGGHRHHHHDHGEEGHHHHHEHGRSYAEIVHLIESSTLPAPVIGRALGIFKRIARAEARIHKTSLEAVHFHEVGAVDSIVDVCAAALGLHLLGIEYVTCSEIGIGQGARRMAHGLVPIPAPATAEIIQGLPVRRTGIEDELLTPTGAAILAELTDEFLPTGSFRLDSVGYGAGSTDRADPPNVVRVQIGHNDATSLLTDRVSVLETQVDDMTGEDLGYLRQCLEEAGALDFLIQPVQMKKDRPGHLLCLICQATDEERLGRLLLQHSSSLGYRRRVAERRVLQRDIQPFATPWGVLKMKLKLFEGRILSAKPEFEDLARLAAATGMNMGEIRAEVQALWRRQESAGL